MNRNNFSIGVLSTVLSVCGFLFTEQISAQFFWRDFPDNIKTEDINFNVAKQYYYPTCSHTLYQELRVDKLKNEYIEINYGLDKNSTSITVYKEINGKLLTTSRKTYIANIDKIKESGVTSCNLDRFDTTYYDLSEWNYTYNRQGNPLRSKGYYRDGTSCETLFRYNSDGLLQQTENVCDSKLMYIELYAYDSNRNIIEKLDFRYSVCECNLWHSAMKDSVQSKYPEFDSICLHSVFRYHTVDENTTRVDKCFGETTAPPEYEKVESDTEKKRRTKFTGKSVVNKTDENNYTKEYYKKGLLVKSVKYASGKSPFLTTNKYDKSGNLIETSNEDEDSFLHNTYYQDKYGNEIKYTQDNSHNQELWIIETVYEYPEEK